MSIECDACGKSIKLSVFTVDLSWAGVISAIAHDQEEAYSIMKDSVVLRSMTKEEILKRMEAEPVKIGIIVENLGDS